MVNDLQIYCGADHDLFVAEFKRVIASIFTREAIEHHKKLLFFAADLATD